MESGRRINKADHTLNKWENAMMKSSLLAVAVLSISSPVLAEAGHVSELSTLNASVVETNGLAIRAGEKVGSVAKSLVETAATQRFETLSAVWPTAHRVQDATRMEQSPDFNDLYLIEAHDRFRMIHIYCSASSCQKNRSVWMTA